MGNFFKKLGNFIKWMLIVLIAGSILLVFMHKYVPVYFSPLMFIRVYEQIAEGREMKMEHKWIPMEEIPQELPLACVSCEDQNYLNHNGFDWDAIKKVLDERESGERFRGGSTISQQTAKNVFLFPTSSSGSIAWMRKGLEAYYTILIETFWSKQRIMEVYLNTIEMGDGIYGAQAVAQKHFGRDAKDLTREQCALIAVSLPNPLKFNSGNPSSYMYKRQAWCLKQMKWLGKFPMTPEEQKEMEEAKAPKE